MKSLYLRLSVYLSKHGILRTLCKLLSFPFIQVGYIFRERKITKIVSLEEKFSKIYEVNYWGDKESVSGFGSTMNYTNNLRKELPKLLEKYNIKKFFDAPCGDFNWMRHVINEYPIEYIGGDIVVELIDECKQKYSNVGINFLKIDLTKDKYPFADLMLCRDLLFHLSYFDIKLILKKFIDSNIEYLLTTSYINNHKLKNRDIKSGGFRKIDLLLPPFNFSSDISYVIDDSGGSIDERKLYLYHRDQVICAYDKFLP